MIPSERGAARALPEPLLAHSSFLVFQLMRESRRIVASLGDLGLRLSHLNVLSCLAEFGTAAQKEISDRLRIDASDLVAVLDDLERAGFVARDRDPRDRRRYAVRITDPGRAALAARMDVVAELDRRLFAPLDDAERATLHGLLRRALAHHDPESTGARAPRR
jgi:MarR family transcriptional regulator, lower aerobic nicotinate degradation pathway regulator